MVNEYVSLEEQHALIALPNNTIGAHVTVAVLDKDKNVDYVTKDWDRQFLINQVQETADGYFGELVAPEGAVWIVVDIPCNAVHVNFVFDVFVDGQVQQMPYSMAAMDIALAFAHATDYIGDNDIFVLTDEGHKYAESLCTDERV